MVIAVKSKGGTFHHHPNAHINLPINFTAKRDLNLHLLMGINIPLNHNTGTVAYIQVGA